MPKLIDIEAVTKQLDESLKEAQANRETSYMARAALEVGRPMHLFRARERNRGTSPDGVLEGLCEETAKAVALELCDADCPIDDKFRLFNFFLQALAATVGEIVAKRDPTKGTPEIEAGHA